MEVQVKSMDLNMLGEDLVIQDILKLLCENKSCLINIYGEQGSGKTELIDQINNYLSKEQYVSCSSMDEYTVNEQVFEENKNYVIIGDNIDKKYSQEQFKNILIGLFKVKQIKVIFTSSNKFFSENLLGINFYNFEAGNRTFTYEEYVQFVLNGEEMNFISEIGSSEMILKNTFLFASYCKNFNYIHEVFSRIKKKLSKNNNSILPNQFVEILKDLELTKLNRDLLIDTKNIESNEFMFKIRPKNKIEKLRDIILRYYPDENVFGEVIKSQFNTLYIDDTFKVKSSFEDKLLNICLSINPVELLIKLLGPRDIILELNERNIGEAGFANTIEDKAKLILKSIGFNILQDPKGIEYFHDLFLRNEKTINRDAALGSNKEYILGLGISCFQEMESIFYELVNFYSNYFCGSTREFFYQYNLNNETKINKKRVTFGQYIGLFSFVNRLAKMENYQLKSIAIGRKEIIPNRIIKKIEELSSHRTFFSHAQSVQKYEVQYSTFYNRSLKVYNLANEIINELIEYNVFPKIVKIKQIIFDEFGRHFFIGVDWNKNEIQFSLSYKLKDIDIYTHYYLLTENKNRAIDPIIIPVMVDDNEDLAYNGSNYQKSSQTQLAQGESLISSVELKDRWKVLDVGCGNGKTTLQLFNKNKSVTIDAFDISESMISIAISNREQEGISGESINFYTLDALKLDRERYYDLIFSNATLHWVTDSFTMYSKLYRALVSGGKLAVHQGGKNSYIGLQEAVKKAIEKLDLEGFYQNWTYPIFYPTKKEIIDLLSAIGFVNIKVVSKETDGKEFPNLVENYANAGMLPFLNRLPDENMRNKLKSEYFKICQSEKINTYTHRLYIYADREE